MSEYKVGDKVWYDRTYPSVITYVENKNYVHIRVDGKFYIQQSNLNTPYRYSGGRVRTDRIIPMNKPKPHNYF
tara:strand:- start:149 stop:367 length:219 start_codon:yes stop_codon:yes gene_type:complete